MPLTRIIGAIVAAYLGVPSVPVASPTIQMPVPTPSEEAPIPVRFFFDGNPFIALGALHGASKILGRDIVVDNTRGGLYQITVMVGPRYERSSMLGIALVTKGCRRAVVSVPDAQTVAHEIGHALGLMHSKDQTNLMFPTNEGGIGLSPEQRLAIDKEIDQLHTGKCLVNP